MLSNLLFKRSPHRLPLSPQVKEWGRCGSPLRNMSFNETFPAENELDSTPARV